MKPTSISYSESKESFDISTGLKSWRKAGMEAELQDGDIYLDCFDELRKEIAHVLNGGITVNPEYANHLEQSRYPSAATMLDFLKTPLPTIDYSAKENVEKAIEDCKTPHELDLLMGYIAKHQLVPQYLEKKKSLK